jgi:hypothetical protein
VRKYEGTKQSTRGGFVVGVGEEDRVGRMGGPVVAHDAVKMVMVEDAINHLRHGGTGLRRAIDLEKEHEPMLDPFLGGKILKVEVMSATTGKGVVCDEDGANIVFHNESRFCDTET